MKEYEVMVMFYTDDEEKMNAYIKTSLDGEIVQEGDILINDLCKIHFWMKDFDSLTRDIYSQVYYYLEGKFNEYEGIEENELYFFTILK